MLRALVGDLRNSFRISFFSTITSNTNGNKIDENVLLKVADNFMRRGKVRTAEEIYKSTIEEYPRCEEAYHKLWTSWASHRSLKVTEKELNDFMNKYIENIDCAPKETVFPDLKSSPSSPRS